MKPFLSILSLFIQNTDCKNCLYQTTTLRNDIVRFIISMRNRNYNKKIEIYSDLQIKYMELFNAYYGLPEQNRIVIETMKDLLL